MANNCKIGFRRGAQVYIVGDDTLILRDNLNTHILTDSMYAAVAPLLDGTRAEDEIVGELVEEHPAEELYYALLRLQSKGHIVGIDRSFPAAEIAYWHGAGADLPDIIERRGSRRLAVAAVADIPQRTALESLLIDNGIVLTEPDDAFLVVVLTDDYMKLDAVAERRFAAGTPWLPVCLNERRAWVGPLFSAQPIQWRYLRRRLDQNLHAALIRDRGHDAGRELFRPHVPAIKSCEGLGIGFAATEVTRALLMNDNLLENRVVTLDTVDNRTEDHPLPDVGTLIKLRDRFRVIRKETSITLQSRPKRFFQDGGFRSELPDATLSRIEPFISSLAGIVPPIKRLGAETGVHVFVTRQSVAGAAFSAAGKGISITQSKVSCCAEAFERYCAQFRGDEPRAPRRYEESGTGFIHPGKLLNISERQYQTRKKWNKDHRGFNWVPERFDASAEIEWTPVWSLSRGQRRWLPTAYCYHGYSITSGPRFCRGDSNGCAAGNNREEAVLQGLFELIERDAAALWWYNRIRRPRIDLDTRRSSYVDEVIRFHDRIGRDVSAIDITSDLRVPVVAAISWSREDGGNISVALGSHLDLNLAVSRALSELNQMSVHQWTAGSGESNTFARHEHELWKKEATIHNQPFLGQIDARTADLDAYRYSPNEDLRDDIQLVLDRLENAGLETLVLDLTREDCPLSVVRMAVPGLRHFWARYGPGRLYDVPVTMGWLPEPSGETDLNPIPVFI